MFNKKKNKLDNKETVKPSPFNSTPAKISRPKNAGAFGSSRAAGSNVINIISPGTRIEGEIFSNGDIRIDGVVDGYVKTKAKIVVGPKGMVKGEMSCDCADVIGKVDGKLIVKNELNVNSSAYITGELSTYKLVVESGAYINGKCIVGSKNTTITSQSEGSNSTGGLAGKFQNKEAV